MGHRSHGPGRRPSSAALPWCATTTSVVLGLLFSTASHAAEAYRSQTGVLDPERDARVFVLSRRGVDAYHDDDFDKALAAFEEVTRLAPEIPNGHVLVAAANHAMMADYRNRAFERPFERAIETAIARAEARIESGEGAVRARQFMGAAYGFKGLYSTMKGSWFAAYRDGLRLKDALDATQRARPEIADADFGLGYFYYWRTVKASVFAWLRLVEDQRAEGIRRLERAIAKGEICNDLAEVAMIRVLINERRYREADAMASAFQKRYPGNIGTWWLRGRSAVAQGDWDAARAAHQEVQKRLARKSFTSPEALVEARYYLALADARQGRAARARPVLREIVEAEDDLDDDLWEELDYVDEARRLLDSL